MTEIFGTLGPACADPEILAEMFKRGMTGIRLNLSHTGLKQSSEWLQMFQEAAENAGVKADLLIDMQGPELRIGTFEFPFTVGERDLIDAETQLKAPQSVLDVLERGDHVLIDDGLIELKMLDTRTAEVLRGGIVTSRKSIKVVNKNIHGPVLTEQDKENIRLAKQYGVTALMQPFVTDGEQLREVREELDRNGCSDIRIFAKIESREGIENIDGILPYTDMVVIARGDLGNDMPLWQLPAAQKYIEEKCIRAERKFLVVTQMLASMIHSPVPTRAEVSDIFNAVLDGADAVMVTNETAAGEFPAEVIRYLKNTADEAEKYFRSL